MRFVAPVLIVVLVGGVAFMMLQRAPRAAPAVGALYNQLTYAEVATSSSPGALQTASSTAWETQLQIPILVYHIVRPRYPSDSLAVRDLAQTPEIFNEEMTHLEEAGYHVVGFSTLENALASSTPLLAKSVILSFDDGWRDQFTYALPILKAHGYTATFFVFTNGIGRPAFFTWSDLRAMLAAGMTIGSHSKSHPYLTHLPLAQEADEIIGSKILLEQELGVPIEEFAYPFGAHDATTTTLVRRAGYRSARGDLYTGGQSLGKLYNLSALNAPTTTMRFDEWFP